MKKKSSVLSSYLEVRNLSKEYDNKIILKGLNFNIKSGEFVSILGPSGSGKSTILKILAGLEPMNSGEIFFENKLINKEPPYKRSFNIIFQNFALFPHMDVYENIAYGPRIKKWSKEVIDKEVDKLLKLVKLVDFKHASVDTLSGGQQQRVAIARALINKPKILLLDEALSALDPLHRKVMQVELKRIQKEVGITFILVTHDQNEALLISDRIILINQGQIKQIGDPIEIYNEPDDLWTATFIGKSNIIKDGIFVKNNFVKWDDKEFYCLDIDFGENEPVDIVLRPEDIKICFENKGFFNGVIISKSFQGVHWEVVFKADGSDRIYLVDTTINFIIGKRVAIQWDEDAIHVMWKEGE
ncbi:ABC transporter ATP-binding protein [Mycoplasma sp. SG1]|nr:ABC transporter ATP-binding protein [Mycoplasma sp. SG1]